MFQYVERVGLVRIASHAAAEPLHVVGIKVCIKAGTTDRYVELSGVDEPIAAHGVNVDDDAIDCRPLRRVRRRGVTEIDVSQLDERRADLALAIQSQGGLRCVERNDCSEFAVSNFETPLWRAELDTIADGDSPWFGAEHFHSAPPRGIERHACAVTHMQREGVTLGINVLNGQIGALGDAAFLAAATECQNIALLVVARVGELGASQVTPHEDGVLATPILDVSLFDQKFADFLVQRLAFVVAGTDDQHLLSGLMSSQTIQRDTLVPCRSVTNLRKAALFREQAERCARLAARGQLDGALQLRVALAAHYLQFGDSHVIRKQLPDGRSRFDRMVLLLIADKKNSLDALLPRGPQDSVRGSRGEQAGFIHDPQFRPGARRQGILE